ncbi:hypothetical protein FH972_023709 [Carpinus fangiana]|uniref:Uncharacterized protein n=1 Tax=Carpinus fangiana TaxID=176857 RepID=A0A5N6KWR7_9ROSI|nr:hypothetical protein FH972_023709 [Carpinus fangiana]
MEWMGTCRLWEGMDNARSWRAVSMVTNGPAYIEACIEEGGGKEGLRKRPGYWAHAAPWHPGRATSSYYAGRQPEASRVPAEAENCLLDQAQDNRRIQRRAISPGLAGPGGSTSHAPADV